MRKCMFLTVFLSLCVVNFSAFAATSRASSAATRSATRTSTVTPSAQSGATSTQSVVSRAATKQKAITAGTKVVSATENTAVPQDCQNAFFGCMDAFCMLDSASGGRCQCSDRVTELDKVLEDILKLDEQTYLMATEGVELIQMGEAEEQVLARVKAASEKVVGTEDSSSKKNTRTLDLSAWNSSIFDDDEDEVFDTDSVSVSTFAEKKGNDLYVSSAKMCVKQIPDKCKDYGTMLQLVYSQKIKSDCVAYENSLKQQKTQSQQKLQTAEKALRDAALDEYHNQNKYATLGDCTIAFTKCMQTDAGCGSDYTGCVVLAAQENVRSNASGSIAKQVKIKGVVRGADITLAAYTMDQLERKKIMCESVTKQCVNANKNDAVWDAFLHNAAPALKSAELIAEQNLRSNCLPSVADCFKNSCKSQFTDDDVGYDACLANPLLYKSLCKVQLEPCLEATGGTYDNPTDSSLWNGLVALLNAMKVDACTKEVKSCIMSNCGEDYSECVGLTTEDIGNLCPYQTLTACMSAGKYEDEEDVRDYVAQVANGIALQINNALATSCENAVNAAMINVCGDNESCDSMISDNMGTGTLNYQVCQYVTDNNGNITINQESCRDSAALVTTADLGLDELTVAQTKEISSIYSSRRILKDKFLKVFTDNKAGGAIKRVNVNYVNVTQYTLTKAGDVSMYSPFITGAIDWDSMIKTNSATSSDGIERISFACVNANNCDTEIVDAMNNTLNRIIGSIESDRKVQYCINGRTVAGFDSSEFGSSTPTFPNLTRQISQDIADAIYAKVLDNYNGKLSELEAKQDDDYLALAEVYKEAAAENSEKAKTAASGNACSALNRNNTEWNRKEEVSAVYSESTHVCTKTTTITTCAKPKKANNPRKRYCKQWNDSVVTTETISM